MSVVLIGQFVAGVALLVAGATGLVRGASGIAAAAGLSPLVVGLTIVAYGTSAPETAVSLQAALGGSADVALGNVVGSNIFNVLFVLGFAAIIAPLSVDRNLLRRDIWVMIAASALVPILALQGPISRTAGAALLIGAATYTVWLVRAGKKEESANAETKAPPKMAVCLALAAGGLAALVIGADFLVDSATAMARNLGVSELVIGLTVVAAGTSLPEVATSVVAVYHGERDLAVGNVVGSNIFNILTVLGATAAFAPGGVAVDPAALSFDIPIMVAAAAACLPIFFTHGRIDRWEGCFFLGGYAAYAASLYLRAAEAEARHLFADAMVWFILPLAALTLAASVVHALRNRRIARA